MQTAVARSFGLKPVTRRVSFSSWFSRLASPPLSFPLHLWWSLLLSSDFVCSFKASSSCDYGGFASTTRPVYLFVRRCRSPATIFSVFFQNCPLCIIFSITFYLYYNKHHWRSSSISIFQGSRQVTRAAVEFYGPGKSSAPFCFRQTCQ